MHDDALTLRPEVAAFAQAMERRLRANDHKPGWEGDTPHALLARLREEYTELAALLWRTASAAEQFEGVRGGNQLPIHRPDGAAVTREAVDVANFALMIADVCGGLPAPDAQETTP